MNAYDQVNQFMTFDGMKLDRKCPEPYDVEFWRFANHFTLYHRFPEGEDEASIPVLRVLKNGSIRLLATDEAWSESIVKMNWALKWLDTGVYVDTTFGTSTLKLWTPYGCVGDYQPYTRLIPQYQETK